MTSKTGPDFGWCAAQDDCLIAVTDGINLPTSSLMALPPWRAVLVARVAARAGIGLQQGTVAQLVAEAREVGGKGTLGPWWARDGML
ncbi:MAG: hypothetical protein NVS3B12_30940 [Acidimicrobiales bacterium]